jgi:hypothetical protein
MRVARPGSVTSVVNVQSIDIQGSGLARRSASTFAAAQRPAGGWRKYTSISASQAQNSRIRLDIKWNNSMLYATAANRDVNSRHWFMS